MSETLDDSLRIFWDALQVELQRRGEKVRLSELGQRVRKPPQARGNLKTQIIRDPFERFVLSGHGDNTYVELRHAVGSAELVDSFHSNSSLDSPRAAGGQLEDHCNSRAVVDRAHFVCPITQEEMVDPVLAADGFTYEREAIMRWFQSCNRSPQTNNPVTNTSLVPNRLLKQIIEDANQHRAGSSLVGKRRRRDENEAQSCLPEKRARAEPRSRFSQEGEHGLWVYEVSTGSVIVSQSRNHVVLCAIPAPRMVLSRGQLVCVTFRQANASGVDVVQMEHGLGWLAAESLCERPITLGLKVFQALATVGRRKIPDHGAAFKDEETEPIRDGQLLSTRQTVTGIDGTIYARVGEHWIPDHVQCQERIRLLAQRPILALPNVQVLRVTNGHIGLAIREWPCYSSSPMTAQIVPTGQMVGSRGYVVGEHQDVFWRVHVNGTDGWLFETRQGGTTLVRVQRPLVDVPSPGRRIHVQLGPNDSWLVVSIRPHTAERGLQIQVKEHSKINRALVAQLDAFMSEGRAIQSVALCPDGRGWAVYASKPGDGPGDHVATGGLHHEVQETLRRSPRSTQRFSLGTDERARQTGVLYDVGPAGELCGSRFTPGSMFVNAQQHRCFVLPRGQYVVVPVGTAGCLHANLHNNAPLQTALSEAAERNDPVQTVTVSPSGAWVLVSDRGVLCSQGVPPECSESVKEHFRLCPAVTVAEYEAAVADAPG